MSSLQRPHESLNLIFSWHQPLFSFPLMCSAPAQDRRRQLSESVLCYGKRCPGMCLPHPMHPCIGPPGAAATENLQPCCMLVSPVLMCWRQSGRVGEEETASCAATSNMAAPVDAERRTVGCDWMLPWSFDPVAQHELWL